MPRISPVDASNNTNGSAETLALVQAKLGMLPNLFTTLALSPASLDGYLQLSNTLAGGRLTSRQRELIAIAVAQENACEYCLSAHTAIGKGVGLDQHAVDLARNGGSDNPVNDAIIAFALRVVRARGGITNDDLDAIRGAVDDDGVIIEIIANVVINIFSNYVNRVAGTEIDFPLVSLDSAA